MRAVILKAFGSAANFVTEDLETPAVLPGHVLVNIKAAAFNPIDYQMRRGGNESKLLRSRVLGREFSGVVTAVSPGAGSFKPGDRVAAYAGSLGSNGTYAEFISVPYQLLAPVPSEIGFEEAAATPTASLTAQQCLNRLTADPSSPIFIAGGAGGVGAMTIKLMLSEGFAHIFTTAGSAGSRKSLILAGLDASRIFDYHDENLETLLYDANGQRKFGYCIDLVGGKLSEVSARLLQVYGAYFNVTNLVTADAARLLFSKAASIHNIANYAIAVHGDAGQLAQYGQQLAALFLKMAKGFIHPPAVQVIGPLAAETVVKAHEIMEANHTYGKKLVIVNS